MNTKPYFNRHANLDTHWFTCSCCGGKSWDSDAAALAGKDSLGSADVMHDQFCPGKVSPGKYVRRVTSLY